MAGKGLPKKYAKMGFAKGWKAYRASKRSRPKTKTKTKSRTMAKRKTYRRRGSSKKFTDILIGGAGAAITSSMIPGGAAGKLAVGYLGYKKTGVIGAVATGLGILGVIEVLGGGNVLGKVTSGLGNIGGGVTSD